MCGECASSPATLAEIAAHRQTECDSCGESGQRLDMAEFTVSNILVTAYICDDCRFGIRGAVMPDWLRKP